jgi:hypothetical protein
MGGLHCRPGNGLAEFWAVKCLVSASAGPAIGYADHCLVWTWARLAMGRAGHVLSWPWPGLATVSYVYFLNTKSITILTSLILQNFQDYILLEIIKIQILKMF